jgi:hypothetical protein
VGECECACACPSDGMTCCSLWSRCDRAIQLLDNDKDDLRRRRRRRTWAAVVSACGEGGTEGACHSSSLHDRVAPAQGYEGHHNFTFEDKFTELGVLGKGSFSVVLKVRALRAAAIGLVSAATLTPSPPPRRHERRVLERCLR